MISVKHVTSIAVVAALSVGAAAATVGASVPDSTTVATTVPAELEDLYAPQPLAEETTLKIAISSRIESFLNLLLADAMGEFEKENITVEFEVVPTSDSTLLLSQGRVDAVPTSMSAGNFNLIGDGGLIRGVIPLHGEPEGSGQGFWVRTDALGGDGFQPSDLEGQRVLTPSGPGSYSVAYFWDTVLREAGLSATDITWERIGVSDAPLALTSGAASAALVLTPFWQVVEDDGCCEFIGGYPQDPISFVAFGPNLLNDNPEAGQAFVRAVARTTVTYLQGDYHNDPEVSSVAAELLEQPLDVFQSQPSLVWSPDFAFDVANFDVVQDFFRDADVLSYETPLTLDDIFDPRFIDALGDGS